ncbi:uncharacterized protein VTP21DRAFT_5192 [Calcarisporiella thermophila]|uniref:uncharacterized protein n=1 Tax=Calcarisporiella thermophila TaxID=911321 RepID=UPI00374425CB
MADPVRDGSELEGFEDADDVTLDPAESGGWPWGGGDGEASSSIEDSFMPVKSSRSLFIRLRILPPGARLCTRALVGRFGWWPGGCAAANWVHGPAACNSAADEGQGVVAPNLLGQITAAGGQPWRREPRCRPLGGGAGDLLRELGWAGGGDLGQL